MAARRLGYKPDPPDNRDLDLRSLQLPTASLPRAATLRGHVREVFDQGSTSSCVAQSFAQAIVVAEEHVGVTLPPPSRLFIYANARKQHSAILTDDGTYLRCAANALYKLGAPPESDWPFLSSWMKVNRTPPFTAYMRAHGRRGGGYFRLSETGSDRVDAIKSAIATGLPVVFGTTVTKAFLESAGPVVVDVPRPDERRAGGHAMCVVGYETMSIGTYFEVVNSWGTGWRDHGFFRMTENYMRWPATSDLWCVRGWETVRDVA